jgi:dnd system-associated protein 4
MRAVRRLEKHEDLLELLTRKYHDANPNSGDVYAERPEIIGTIREALCFAAILGFREEKKKKLTGNTMEIKSDTFEHEPDAVSLIWALAVADTEGTDILRPENDSQMVQIFEEYANGGLDVMARWLKDTPNDPYCDEAIREGFRSLGLLDKSSNEVDIGSLNPDF